MIMGMWQGKVCLLGRTGERYLPSRLYLALLRDRPPPHHRSLSFVLLPPKLRYSREQLTLPFSYSLQSTAWKIILGSITRKPATI